MRTMSSLLSAAFVAALSGIANAAPPELAPPAGGASPAISAAASVDTSFPAGRCPSTVHFTATISATDWSPTALRQIQYKWIRSDNANSPTQTLDFGAGRPQSQTVTDTWQLGKTYSGFEAVQIVYPQPSTSNHAAFTLTCNSDGGASLSAGGASANGGGASPEDCIPYDNQNLTLVDTGAYWRLQDGSMYMQIFDTHADGERGLDVARHHSKQCFIGRDNHRPDRNEFIMEYWK